MNKYLYLTVIIGLMTFSSYGQAIIPFADLSDQNRSMFSESTNSNKLEYQNYPEQYRKALTSLDNEIKDVDNALNRARSQSNQKSLQQKRSELHAKRELLLEEAGLVEDLNEFY